MIPKIIVQTSICKPQQYIIDLFCKFAPNWKYEHYNDVEVLQFFSENPHPEFLNITEKFNSIPYGQHKADLFRYYFLYIKGGVFIDSDAMLNAPIEEIINNYEFFTVTSDHVKDSIFQGFIGACPNNIIIYKALMDAYTINIDQLTHEFHILCRNLYKIIYECSYNFPLKIYIEADYNDPATKTFDSDAPDKILLFHYWKFKIILRNPPAVFITPLVIVTPCSRPENLEKLRKSIQFDNDHFQYWIIIYDTRYMPFIKRYENEAKIMEFECKDDGVVGHQIRNMALREIVREGLIYFLDDDTILHPYFWTIVNNFRPEINIYTFNLLYQNGTILYGNNPTIRNIDTCQFIFHKKAAKNYAFTVDDYCGDGLFIQTLYQENQDSTLFVNSIGAYYNWLNKAQPKPIGL
jgi:hypothetical protein